jgi:hypothetical protein
MVYVEIRKTKHFDISVDILNSNKDGMC